MCGSPCLPPILGTGLSSENHTSFSLTGILRHHLQFVIPGFRIGKKDISSFEQLARNCGDVDKVKFDRATGKVDKQSATLVSIAFHYVPEENEEAHKDTAGKFGRQIAERFVSLLSFGVGQRLIAVKQQVTKVLEGGRLQTRLALLHRSG